MSAIRHILLIPSWYPNRNNWLHGIFNREFAETIALNHKVSVIHVCSDSTLQSDIEVIEEMKGNVFSVIIYYKQIKTKIPLLSQFLKKRKLIQLYEKGFEIIQRKRGLPDIMQLNVVLPAGIGAKHLSDKHQIPLVINECWTGYMPEDGNYKGFVTKYFTKKIVSHAKVIMPVSESLKENMIKHHLSGNYKIVPNVVDVDVFKPIQSIQKTSGKTRFMHISTFDQTQKNPTGILNAFENAYQTNSSIELTFLGNIANANYLKKFVAQKKLENVIHFKGPLTKTELVEEINSHDALIMFSNYESFCLVIAETMACGIPVITSQCGGITSILPEHAGLKITKQNEEELCKAILNFAKNKSDYKPERIRQFITDHFSATSISKRLTEIYDSILIH